MAEDGRKGLRAVSESEVDDYKKKIRAHRIRIAARVLIVAAVIFMTLSGIGVYLSQRNYEDFELLSSADRSDTKGTRFLSFQGNILKYSNDGAFYTDSDNELIWNQTYEMQDPQTDVCEGYLAIYDKKGTKVYIMSEEGLQGSIETTMEISQARVAAQGTVALLMKKDGASYLSLYDREGNSLAQGAIHGTGGGYPIAIALSHDAIKLAVSMIDINEGALKSAVAFYNFGSVGQNEIDNCVGILSFDGMVIPEIDFATNDRLVAFGDSKIVMFEGTQKPEATVEIPLKEQVKSIFYNRDYVGVVIDKGEEQVSHSFLIYDKKGALVLQQDFDSEYDHIEFLSDGEICIRSQYGLDLYTLRGTHRFHYEFGEELCQVMPGALPLHYTVLLGNATEKIRLK